MRRKGLKGRIISGLGACGLAMHLLSASAQCPATIPNIQEYGTGSYSVKKIGDGCLPYTVSFGNSMTGVTNIKTIFDYQGGTLSPANLTTDTLHTYTRPGVYTIVQLSEKNGRKLIACPKVYVTDTLAPVVSLARCGNFSARVLFDSQQPVAYDIYWISWGDGNVQEISPRLKSVTHTYPIGGKYQIAVWGITKPGLCRSQRAHLTFDPVFEGLKPSIEEFRLTDAITGDLKIDNPLKTELVLLRSTASGGWESTGRTLRKESETIKVYVDSSTVACYQLQATDSCLAESYKSEPICSAVFSMKPLEKANELTWRTSDMDLVTEITLRKDNKDWKNIFREGLKGSQLDNELLCGQEHCYELVIKSNSSKFISRPICRISPPIFCGIYSLLHIPDAFSPNGDGLNDAFEIKGDIATPFSISIFNSWGAVIYQTNDIKLHWKGTFQDVPLPSGHYPYLINVVDPASGKHHTRSGSVLLIR